jgi:hypothetical protein
MRKKEMTIAANFVFCLILSPPNNVLRSLLVADARVMKKNNRFSRKAAVYYAKMIYFPNICLRTKNSLYIELNIKETIVCQAVFSTRYWVCLRGFSGGITITCPFMAPPVLHLLVHLITVRPPRRPRSSNRHSITRKLLH